MMATSIRNVYMSKYQEYSCVSTCNNFNLFIVLIAKTKQTVFSDAALRIRNFSVVDLIVSD